MLKPIKTSNHEKDILYSHSSYWPHHASLCADQFEYWRWILRSDTKLILVSYWKPNWKRCSPRMLPFPFAPTWVSMCTPEVITACFLDVNAGFRKYFNSGLFLEESIGVGILQSFLHSDGVFTKWMRRECFGWICGQSGGFHALPDPGNRIQPEPGIREAEPHLVAASTLLAASS